MNQSTFSKFYALTLVLVACGALTGCSGDKDNDRQPDDTDQCPTVSAGTTPDPARPGCPAIDTDRDGILDHNDVCPGMPVGNGVEADPNRAGCPAPVVIPTIPTPPPVLPNGEDHDGDGVVNDGDQCPTVPAGTPDERDPSRAGCPAGDRDGDGVKDHDDRCPGDSSTTENDPDGDGCANPDGDHDGVLDAVDQCPDLPQTPDAGTPSGDGGTVETDASATDVVDAGNPHPGCPAGHEPTVALNDGAVETDATATPTDPDSGTVQATDASVATNDVVPGNGNTTVIVQVTPPTPAPVVDAGTPSQPIPTERTVSGLAVGTLIEGASDRTAANAFCWVTRREVSYLMGHTFNRVCREGETGCWRLSNANVRIQDCTNTATPGCRYQDGRIFACAEGAENSIVWRCAEGTVPCTAQNASDAWRSRHHPRR